MPRIKSTGPALNKKTETVGERPGEASSNSRISSFLIRLLDNISAISLFLIFFGIPLFITNSTLQGIGFEKQIFFYFALGLGILSWVLKSVLENKIVLKRTPLDIPIILFLLVALATSFFSVDKAASFTGAYQMPTKNFLAILAMAVFYWFLVNNIDRKKLNFILSGFILSFAGIIAVVFLNFFSVNLLGNFSPAWLRIIGDKAGFNTIGLVSNLQIFLSAAIFIIIGLAGYFGLCRETDVKIKLAPIKRVFLTLVFAGLLVCFSLLVLSNFNSLAGFLIGLAFLLLLAIFQLIKINRKFFSGISLLFALVILYFLLGKPVIKIREFNSEATLSGKVCWDIAKNTISSRPFQGVGLGNFEYAFNNYRQKELNENDMIQNVRFLEATGIVNEAIITMGLPGILALALMILIFLGVVFTFFRSKSKDEFSAEKILAAALLAGCVSLFADMVLGLIGTALILYLVSIASLAVALVYFVRPDEIKKIELSYRVKPQYSLLLLFCLILAGGILVFIFISAGKIYLADCRAKEALAAQSSNDAAILLENSITLNPRQNFYYQKMGDIKAEQGIEALKKNDKKGAEDLFRSALEYYKTATLISPANASVWDSAGSLAEALSQYDITLLLEAENAYKKASELNPLSANLLVRLASIKGKIADSLGEKDMENKKKIYEEAVAILRKAAQLKTNSTELYDNKGAIEEKLGKWDDAINSATESYKLNSGREFYPFNLGRLYYNRAIKNNNFGTSTPEAAENTDDLMAAEELFKRAIEIKPGYSDAVYSLAVLYEHLGRKEEAKTYYQKVLDLLPESEKEAKDVIKKKLESL